MEGMQPPTPKEDYVIAKNPFETDFDIPANNAHVSSFFNYSQTTADNISSGFGPSRNPAFMQSAGPMFSGNITGQRSFPYPSNMGNIGNDQPNTLYSGGDVHNTFNHQSNVPNRPPQVQTQENFPSQNVPISAAKTQLTNVSNSKNASSSQKIKNDNQTSAVQQNRQNVQPANLVQSGNNNQSNVPASPISNAVNVNAPITHLNIAICASCRQDILEGDDRLNCFSGCSSNSYHRMCAGLSKTAYDLFMKEQNVEWVCDYCISTRQIPLLKQSIAAVPVNTQYNNVPVL